MAPAAAAAVDRQNDEDANTVKIEDQPTERSSERTNERASERTSDHLSVAEGQRRFSMNEMARQLRWLTGRLVDGSVARSVGQAYLILKQWAADLTIQWASGQARGSKHNFPRIEKYFCSLFPPSFRLPLEKQFLRFPFKK